MDVQSAANLNIPEGSVRNIHDKDKRLLWSAVGYDVKYKGDTTQQTYSGKNKMPIQSADLTDNRTKEFVIALPAGTYTYSFDLDSFEVGTNTSFSIYSQFYLSTGTWKDNNISNPIDSTTPLGRKSSTFTLGEDAIIDLNHKSNIRIPATQYNNGARASISNIMIEPGSTATAYEPYVGGIPSPNPDYPQDVNVVTGDQTVNITGKNRISIPSGTKTENGITWTREDGVVHGSGTFETYTYSNFVGTTTLSLPAGDYTFSIKEALPSPLMVEFSTRDNSNVRKNYQIPSGQTSVTKSFPNGLSRTGVALVGGTVGQEIDVTIKNIQIEPGSTATSYEPYQGQTFPVDLGSTELCKIGNYQDYIVKSSGKNIWGGYTAFHKEVSGITFDTTVDGFITAIGTATGTAYSILGSEAASNGTYITLQAGTYHLSVDGTLPSGVGIQAANTSGSVISSSTGSFTLLATTNVVVRLRVESGTAITNGITVYPMLSVGSSSIPYEPYGTDWYVKKETNKLVFNGSENWKQYSQNVYLDTGTFPEGVAVSSLRILGVSNRCDMNTNNMTYNSASHTGIEIRNLVSYWGVATATVADWKTWVSSNNILLYYALVTPTYTKITDTTLVGQLNAIHDWLRRYDYYSVVSGNLPIIINRSGII